MRLNGGFMFFVAFLILVLMAVLYFGWAGGADLLTFGMGFIGLAGLILILKLPWDLYFEARNLLSEQRESIRKNISFPKEDHQYTQKTAKKLLVICLGLHVLATIVISLATYFSDGYLGYYFAGFFLLSTGFRPLSAYYSHQKARFAALRARCKVPREDAINFAVRIKALEKSHKELEKTIEAGAKETQKSFQKTQADLDQLHATIIRLNREYQEKADRVCDEFTRTVDKLSEDKELLLGLRAFIKMIKTT
ncbi:MAG: hypothetical protein GY862_10295 [Gammaproteobacteria bacterium]|nr:hypothetical protein [Gammaproteobacteria bacterium]